VFAGGLRRGSLPIVGALFAAVVAIVGVILLWPSSSTPAPSFSGSPPPPGIRLPAFALRDALGGGAIRSRDLHGKVVLVTFLDTRCKEACPIIAGQIASGLRLLTSDERAGVDAIAITVNPRVDTALHVRAFLAEHRASGSIRYATGGRARLGPVWKAFHVLPAIETGDDDIHSADVRVFDRSGEWISTLHTSVDLTPANLAHDLRLALSSH